MNNLFDKAYNDFCNRVETEEERIITDALKQKGYTFKDAGHKYRFISSRCHIAHHAENKGKTYFLDGKPFLSMTREDKFETDTSDRKYVISVISTFSAQIL